MRTVAMVIASALLVALVGCGDSGGSAAGNAETDRPERGAENGNRQKANFALAKEVCEEGPKADFAVESVDIPADSSDVAIARGYANQWPRNDQEAAFAGCLKGLKKAPARFPRSSPAAQPLWGRSFVVTEVTGVDEEPPVSRPIRIRVSFSQEQRHNIGWQAHCNGFGGDVLFTATRMKVYGYASTAIGCQANRQEEDNWLTEFIQSGPEWQLDGERLRLTSDDATVELRG